MLGNQLIIQEFVHPRLTMVDIDIVKTFVWIATGFGGIKPLFRFRITQHESIATCNQGDKETEREANDWMKTSPEPHQKNTWCIKHRVFYIPHPCSRNITAIFPAPQTPSYYCLPTSAKRKTHSNYEATDASHSGSSSHKNENSYPIECCPFFTCFGMLLPQYFNWDLSNLHCFGRSNFYQSISLLRPALLSMLHQP